MTIISGIVIGAVVAAIGALANYTLTIKREQQRWDREDECQRERWDREDQLRREYEHKFRDYQERRTIYSEFISSVDRLFAGDHSTEAFREYRECDAAVRLIAPSNVETMADRLGRLSRKSRVGNAEFRGALQELLKATREDLGKPPESWAHQ